MLNNNLFFFLYHYFLYFIILLLFLLCLKLQVSRSSCHFDFYMIINLILILKLVVKCGQGVISWKKFLNIFSVSIIHNEVAWVNGFILMLNPSHLSVFKAELVTNYALNIIDFVSSFVRSDLYPRIWTLWTILKCPLLLKLHYVFTLVNCLGFIVFSLEILLVGLALLDYLRRHAKTEEDVLLMVVASTHFAWYALFQISHWSFWVVGQFNLLRIILLLFLIF